MITFLSVVLLISYASAKKKHGIRCQKQTQKFVVDGKLNDWNVDSLRYDPKTGFAYAFSNDDKYLYVELKLLNRGVNMKTLITGFTLWIDPAGKGKHALGIQYPQGRMHQEKPEARPVSQHHRNGKHPAGKPTPEQIKMFNDRYANEIPRFTGFEKRGLHPTVGGDNGVDVLLQMDTLGRLVYEARIPLKLVFENPEDYLKNKKPFSLILETGYMQMDMSRMPHSGMGGRMGGGGMGGQRPNPSRMAMMQEMAEPSLIKIKTIYLNAQ